MKLLAFGVRVLFPGLAAIAFLYPADMLAQAAPSSPASPQVQQGSPAPDPNAAAKLEAERQALGFLEALDRGEYTESYAYTATLIRSKMDRDQFANEVKKDRASAGAEQSRKLMDATYTATLANQPAGRYVVLQYSTDFANKKSAVETVTLCYESSYWRVAGWFLK